MVVPGALSWEIWAAKVSFSPKKLGVGFHCELFQWKLLVLGALATSWHLLHFQLHIASFAPVHVVRFSAELINASILSQIYPVQERICHDMALLA